MAAMIIIKFHNYGTNHFSIKFVSNMIIYLLTKENIIMIITLRVHMYSKENKATKM